MATVKGGNRAATAMRQVAQRIASGATEVRAGFLENASYPDGTPVAAVAVWNEFGTDDGSIPPRPFFRPAVAEGKQHWGKDLAQLVKDGRRLPDALRLMGMEMAADIQDKIIAVQSPALAPSTVARKGSTKPLIETGHMLNSVDSEVT